MQVTEITRVGDLVAAYPGLSGLLEMMGIDFCCGGQRTLAEACKDKRLDPPTVVKTLSAQVQGLARPASEPAAIKVTGMSLTQLVDHIEATHHQTMRHELPHIGSLLQKVISAHGDRHPELRTLAAEVGAFTLEIDTHLAKEEQILFPAIRRLESAMHVDRAETARTAGIGCMVNVSSAMPAGPCGALANPIRVMEMEHESAGQALARFRELTNDFQAPSDACPTWHALLEALLALQKDLHQHIHKENNVLFPKVLSAEASLHGSTGIAD